MPTRRVVSTLLVAVALSGVVGGLFGPRLLATEDEIETRYRVFTTALGHDVATIQTPAFVTTFTRGAEWAATGKVTLPIPPAMAK